jgi:hypothetical protein
MSTSFDSIAYGVLMAILGLASSRFAAEHSELLLMAGLAGATLGLLWGVLGLRGYRGRTLPILTLTAMCGFLMWPVARAWFALDVDHLESRFTVMLVSLMLVFSAVQLVTIARIHQNRPPVPGVAER